MAIKSGGKYVGIKHNAEELATVEWLQGKLKRTASGTYKWLAAEKAEELGFVPTKKKRPSSKA